MQSTLVFIVRAISLKQNTSYCLTHERELTCGKGNSEKPNMQTLQDPAPSSIPMKREQEGTCNED